MDYVGSGQKAPGCVFCAYASHGADAFRDDLTVFADEHTLVTLNRYPYACGHLLIIPRRHGVGAEGLPPGEHDALFRLVTAAAVRLKHALRAQGLNVGMNIGEVAGAGIADHMHVHIVPRWAADNNFMPVVADTRVMPQALDATWAHLVPFFADLPGEHPPVP
jgi:ATP adenylyltransferase